RAGLHGHVRDGPAARLDRALARAVGRRPGDRPAAPDLHRRHRARLRAHLQAPQLVARAMRQARWTESGGGNAAGTPPPLPADWVRLRVAACGICGTDLHLWRRELTAPVGLAPGHEMVGTVLEGPRGLADALYAVEPKFVCGLCDFCVSGRNQ